MPEPAFLILLFALIWHNLATQRFYTRIFLLGYLTATANEHYQSRFKVFHLVGVELHFV